MSGAMMGAIAGDAGNGAAPGTVTLDATYSPTAVGAGPQVASFQLDSDGDVNVNGVDVGDWLSPKASAPSLYEVRATIVSGSLTSGTTGSWLALTSNRSWSLNGGAAGTGDKNCVLTIEIRYNGGAVLDTATVTFLANRL